MRRVLVCGGRDFADKALLRDTLAELHIREPFSVVIHGAARGADSLACGWAQARGIETIAHPADWKAYGKRAGHIRNQQMIDLSRPDLVVAFPGGRGTADMIRRAQIRCIPVVQVDLPQASEEPPK